MKHCINDTEDEDVTNANIRNYREFMQRRRTYLVDPQRARYNPFRGECRLPGKDTE